MVVGLALAGCSDDDSTGDGVAPTSQPDSDDADAAEADEPADEESTTTAAPSDPYSAAIAAQAEAVGVVAIRDEGSTKVLVMEDGSTADDLAPACELAISLLPEGTAVSTDLAGEVAPCP